MDCGKIGRLIASLRKEKGLTQQMLADALNISNKTISKWECGLGCPDLSIWPLLSVILGVDMDGLMEGEITPNRPDTGNISKIRFYVCPCCGNILVSTSGASISCCGRRLEQLKPSEDDIPEIRVQQMDMDYYITIDHEMTKTHYISFIAYVKNDKIFLVRLYPEQNAEARLPYIPGGVLYAYCVQHGLIRCRKVLR
ncbi:MAG: helix-turn-helix domain-containing protein [Clostridiaceae bacterium]|nr:helix-turn-helix domain-containing protein [Clostridiaceae bacterium]